MLFNELKRIEAKIDALLARGRPARGWIIIDCLVPTNLGDCFMAKLATIAIPNFSMAELSTKQATLQGFDANDQPVALPTTPHDHTWVSADPTVVTVTPGADPDTATVASLGKAGTKIRLDCTLHSTDTPPAFPDIDFACTVDVPAGLITQGIINLA